MTHGGLGVPIEVKWDTLQSDKYDKREQYFDWYPKVYFKPLIETANAICVDELGREALRAALKKIVIESSTEFSTFRGTTFEGGVLHIKHSYCTNVDNVAERAQGWTRLLEKAL
jgi:hypothetical protein